MTRTLRASLALLLSVIWVAAGAGVVNAGGGGCHGAFTDETIDEINVAMNCYTPAVARVDVGDTVTWFSGKAEAPHTVTAVSGVFAAGSGDLPPGGRQTASFDEPGVYPYACLLHPGMVGAVVVGGGETNESSTAAVPAPPAGTEPASQPASASLTPVVVGAGVLVVAAGVILVVRRGRTRTAAPPTVAAP